jgi:hypothetical protein
LSVSVDVAVLLLNAAISRFVLKSAKPIVNASPTVAHLGTVLQQTFAREGNRKETIVIWTKNAKVVFAQKTQDVRKT